MTSYEFENEKVKISNSFLHSPFLVTLNFHFLQVCFSYRLYSLEWALTTGGSESPFISETKKQRQIFVQLITVARQIVIAL
jgi:hypothetical protein